MDCVVCEVQSFYGLRGSWSAVLLWTAWFVECSPFMDCVVCEVQSFYGLRGSWSAVLLWTAWWEKATHKGVALL